MTFESFLPQKQSDFWKTSEFLFEYFKKSIKHSDDQICNEIPFWQVALSILEQFYLFHNLFDALFRKISIMNKAHDSSEVARIIQQYLPFIDASMLKPEQVLYKKSLSGVIFRGVESNNSFSAASPYQVALKPACCSINHAALNSQNFKIKFATNLKRVWKFSFFPNNRLSMIFTTRKFTLRWKRSATASFLNRFFGQHLDDSPKGKIHRLTAQINFRYSTKFSWKLLIYGEFLVDK